jgi:DNA replication protein DnaC
MNLLNEEQKYALKCVSEGNNILLTGSAGTGKSYTIKYIIEYLNNANKKYAITASTGTAADYIRQMRDERKTPLEVVKALELRY